MKTVIAVAAHKACELPGNVPYLPVQAGAALRPDLGLTRDDGGENISLRNGLYSELTVHYWLWKNMQADVYGLCHYRRYFTLQGRGRALSGALTQSQAEQLLETAEVIVPRPRVYLIETNYSQYAHAHRAGDLVLARQVIAEGCPDFLPAFDRVMKRCWGRRFNMFIMRREQFEAYSAWLFGILFELEKRLTAAGEPENSRVLGFVAERLLDVWLEKTQPRVRQVRVMHLESQHWPRKIATFLRRRFVPEERLREKNKQKG